LQRLRRAREAPLLRLFGVEARTACALSRQRGVLQEAQVGAERGVVESLESDKRRSPPLAGAPRGRFVRAHARGAAR
jgi:hypothetical protein